MSKRGRYMEGKIYDLIPGGLVEENILVTTNGKESAAVVVVRKHL